MKLLKTVTICEECQMPYYKAPWEPMWLARRAAKDAHTEWHEMAMFPETNPLAQAWMQRERDNITKILKQKSIDLQLEAMESTNQYGQGALILAKGVEMSIALIKGENK